LTRQGLLLVLLLAACFAYPVALLATPGAEDDGVEVIEELDDFDDFEIVEAKPAPEPSELVGRLHPALVHFPIGWIVLVLVLELLTLVFGLSDLERAGHWVLGLGLLAMVPAIASGLLRAGSMTLAAGVYYPVETHRNLAFLAMVVCILALGLRFKVGSMLSGTMRWVYLVLIAVATVLIGLVGHLGGKMVYGENFLPF